MKVEMKLYNLVGKIDAILYRDIPNGVPLDVQYEGRTYLFSHGRPGFACYMEEKHAGEKPKVNVFLMHRGEIDKKFYSTIERMNGVKRIQYEGKSYVLNPLSIPKCNNPSHYIFERVTSPLRDWQKLEA